jgi:hypothetical protein
MHEFTLYMAEVSSEILTAVNVHIAVFWDVALCSFEGLCKPYTLKP